MTVVAVVMAVEDENAESQTAIEEQPSSSVQSCHGHVTLLRVLLTHRSSVHVRLLLTRSSMQLGQ